MIDSEKLKYELQKATATALKNLRDFRHEIESINDELNWIEKSPLPLADVKLKIEQFIKNNTSSEGVHHFFYNYELEGLKPLDAETRLNESVRVSEGVVIGGNGITDLSKMMCSLLGASIQPAFIAMAEEMAKTVKCGPPLAERAQIRKDLLAKKYEVELKEENLISQSEELGLVGFYRREGCNPEIVLMTDEV